MNFTCKIPDYNGGFISKTLSAGQITVISNDGELIESYPVNCLRKGLKTDYGRITDYSDNRVILEKSGKYLRANREVLNTYLLNKSINDSEFEEKHPRSPITGRFIFKKEKYLEELFEDFKNYVVGSYETPLVIAGKKKQITILPRDFIKLCGIVGIGKEKFEEAAKNKSVQWDKLTLNNQARIETLGIIKDLLVDPDKIIANKDTKGSLLKAEYIFVKNKNDKNYYASFTNDSSIVTAGIFGKKNIDNHSKGILYIKKGLLKLTDLLLPPLLQLAGQEANPELNLTDLNIEVNSKPKPMLKAFGMSFALKSPFGANLLRGNERPGHKYIMRKPDPSGEGYIYLYKLPNGQTEWRNKDGESVKGSLPSENAPKEYNLESFKPGDLIKQGDKVGEVLEQSENYIAVDFEGVTKAINKNSHLEKVKEHELYKTGDEIKYEGKSAKILQKTDNLALIKTNDSRLKLILLEKYIERYNTEDNNNQELNYDNQPEYKQYLKDTNDFERVSAIRRKKNIDTGKEIRSVDKYYNPQTRKTKTRIDGQEINKLTFEGQDYDIIDINNNDYIVKTHDGKEAFLSHKEYNGYRDAEDKKAKKARKNFIKVGNPTDDEIVTYPKNTFKFSGKLSPEAEERVRSEKERRGIKIRFNRLDNAPIQSEEDKQKAISEREEKQANIREILSSPEYHAFVKMQKERGFNIGENKYTAKKKIEIDGQKFELSSEFKPKEGTWAVTVDGPAEKLTLGEKEYPITDLSPDKVFYQDGDEEKSIKVEDLRIINGKSLFEPTKASKGLISNLPAQKIYFGTDDKDSALGFYEVVEADDLIASHLPGGEANKRYTISDAQNRDRTTGQSIAQINKIAANPNFDFVSDSKTAQDGAPVVNEDYNIIAGNDRGIGLQLHYQNEGAKYKQDLIKNAEKFGFNAENIEKMKAPVLVRRINIDNKEAQRLGAISNTSNMLAPEERETAKGKATRIDDRTFNNLSELFKNAKGDNNTISEYLDEIGPDIVKELIDKKIIPENEQHLYYNVKTGKLEGNHKDKLKELLLQSVLGGSSQHFERIQDSAREGIIKSLGDLFAIKGKKGDLIPNLQHAIKILSKYNASKVNFNGPDDFIAQEANNVFEPLKASNKDLAVFDLLNNTKPNEIRKKIKDYISLQEPDMFSEGMSPDDAFPKAFDVKYPTGVNKSIFTRIALRGKKLLKSIKEGIRIEKEHKNLYQDLEKRLKEEGIKMPMSEDEFFKYIAKIHIEERKDYYKLLKKYIEKSGKPIYKAFGRQLSLFQNTKSELPTGMKKDNKILLPSKKNNNIRRWQKDYKNSPDVIQPPKKETPVEITSKNKGKYPPNTVFRIVRDSEGELLDILAYKYDGSKESAIKAAEKVTHQMYAFYPDASNIESIIGASDADGYPKYTISPNFRHIADVNTESVEAKYIWGIIPKTSK